MMRYNLRVLGFIALALFAGLATAPTPALAQDGTLQVYFLDVGQGDAVLVQAPDGRAVLYDGGPSRTGALEHLQALGIDSLALVIASHPHRDHIAGLIDVIEAYRPAFVMDSGLPHTTQTYAAFLQAIQSAGSALLDPESRVISLGPIDLRVMEPPAQPAMGLNDSSVGVLVEYGEFRMLLAGDAEQAQWGWWMGEGMVPEGPIQVHKASHHGSRNGDLAMAIQRLQPEVVVIGVGQGNAYGHPHIEALALYESVAATLYRTDQHGSVRVSAEPDGSFQIGTSTHLVAQDGSGEDRVPSPGCVDLNSASTAELQAIIHVGPERAGQIRALREQQAFRSLEDITRVRGIATARLHDIHAQGVACVTGEAVVDGG